jgi:HSP90 family molecular chaperone
VDSEDIPLNISRETMQDSALIQRIRKVLTKRFIKFLEKNAKDDATQVSLFYGHSYHMNEYFSNIMLVDDVYFILSYDLILH